jgi:hypothetical protein
MEEQDMTIGRKRGPLVGILAALLAGAGASPAAPDDGATVHGIVAPGGHVSRIDDFPGRVREYEILREEVEPDLRLELFGQGGGNRFDVTAAYENEQTLDLKARVEAGSHVDFRFRHRSFYHSLDHDRLQNLTWRERVGVDSLGNDVPGGKMLTHEDTDPLGEYGVRYTDTQEGLDVHVPLADGATISADYRDQRRVGTRQILGVDHCANCHVRSQRGFVDESSRDLQLGVSTVVSDVRLGYEFSARDFDNRSAAARNRFMEARHPVNGGSGAEFGSRLIYDNEVLAVSRTPDVEKQGHTVQASVALPGLQRLQGSFSTTRTENQVTGLELTANAASLSWWAPLGKKVHATASLLRRELENDPYAVDLPPWRDGRAGGGQDFDWVRLSAYDREEYVGTARVSWAVRPGHNLRLDYRLRSTDRDHVELDPDDPGSTRTLQNRVRASWNGRLSPGARSRVVVEYEKTDLPFVNVHGICEDGQGEELMPIAGNSFVYYFQRERIGTGGTLPTGALRANAHLTYGFGPRASATGYVNLAFEKNDDLNLYDFDRDVLTPGITVFLAPDDRFVVTGGGSYSRVKSNAKLCATVMDG